MNLLSSNFHRKYEARKNSLSNFNLKNKNLICENMRTNLSSSNFHRKYQAKKIRYQTLIKKIKI